MEYIIVDGEILKKEEINLTPFFWNDPRLLHHKFWFGFGGIPLFSENVALLRKLMNTLGAEIPELFKNQRELFRITKRMLNKNKFFRSGHINFHLFIRNNKVNTVITSISFPEFDFPFSEQGLLLKFSELKKYSESPLSGFQAYHQFIEDAEKPVIADSQFQNSIFLNQKETVCDAAGANIFMMKNNTLVTSSPDTGCHIDILREIVLDIAISLGLKVLESGSIKKEDIFQMNEIFLVSEKNGVQWIMGIEKKRYFRQNSIIIHKKLNEFLKTKVR